MSQASEQIAKQYANAAVNKKNWGDIAYNALVEGLSGDGVSDDTAKLQALINKAIDADRRTILFPHGQYYVTALTNADQVDFVGDNSSFVGGYTGTIGDLGGFAELQDDFNTLEATVNTLESTVNTLDSEFTALDSEFTAFEADFAKEVPTVINLKGYGAVGDGVADDTAAIRAAVAACPAGGIVFFPPVDSDKFYKVTGMLTINKNITLASGNATDNQNGGGLNTRILFYENGYDTAIKITASGVRIDNIMFQYPGGGTTLIYGIAANGMINVTLDRVWFRNFKYAVYFTDCIQCSFRQVNIRDCDIGFRFEVGGTSMYLEQCWVESPLVTGYQMMSHVYCTFVNCLLDGFTGSEPDFAYKLYDSFSIKFVNCASEKVKKSHYYLESCREVSLDTCFGTTGNISTTHLCSFAHINIASDNISFINCKDYQPVGTEMSVTNSTTSPPLFIGCDFPNKFSDVGTVCTIQKNAINFGQASFGKDGLTLLSPNGTRHKIVVSDANVISATTVSG